MKLKSSFLLIVFLGFSIWFCQSCFDSINSYAQPDTPESVTDDSVIDTIKFDSTGTISVNQKTNTVYVTNPKTGTVSIIKGHVAISQDSPLKQISSGIDPNSVICKEGFELVHKSTDNSPACVKPSTAEKLIQRGWARE